MAEITLALISDVHSNEEALQAVLRDLKHKGIKRIWCLGDTLGYGPRPVECLILVRSECELVLLGNHDAAVIFGIPDSFNAIAWGAAHWTIEMLQKCDDSDELREFLFLLSPSEERESFQLAHGSPRTPLDEYVFGEEIWKTEKMQEIFAAMTQRLCFVGHTHKPGVTYPFLSRFEFCPGKQFPGGFALSEPSALIEFERAIVNVGSVGQPRDGDPRACYVLVTFDEASPNDARITWHRVEYDVDKVVSQILEIPALDEKLGQRLWTGS